MAGPESPFKVLSSFQDDNSRGKIARYSVAVDDFPLLVERYEDWDTTVTWRLPDEHDLEHVLTVFEEVLHAVEQNGYSVDGTPFVMVGSSRFAHDEAREFIRPLTLPKLEELFVISADQVNFLRFSDDGAIARILLFGDAADRQGVVTFDQSPQQTASAMDFITKMMPSRLNLQPEQLGAFVLELPRPE